MFAGMKFAIGVVSERIFIIYTTPGYLSLSTVISIQKLFKYAPPRVSKKGAHDNDEKKREKKCGTHTERERERRERDVIRPRATDALFPLNQPRVFSIENSIWGKKQKKC